MIAQKECRLSLLTIHKIREHVKVPQHLRRIHYELVMRSWRGEWMYFTFVCCSVKMRTCSSVTGSSWTMKCSSRRKFVSSSLPITCLPHTDTCNSTISDEWPHGSGTPSPSGTYNQTNPTQLVRITPPLTERRNIQLFLQKQDRMHYRRWIELWTREIVLTTSIYPFHTLHMNDHELQQITRLRMIATITRITRRATIPQRMREVIWEKRLWIVDSRPFPSIIVPNAFVLLEIQNRSFICSNGFKHNADFHNSVFSFSFNFQSHSMTRSNSITSWLNFQS